VPTWRTLPATKKRRSRAELLRRGQRIARARGRRDKTFAFPVAEAEGAARREPRRRSEPGGICVSRVVRDQVRDKLDLSFEDLGEQQVKNIARPVRIFVTARNSSFTYKGQAVEVKRVGRELGVRYVLGGSVRKLGKRVRITTQLIEAKTGVHVWGERYDRSLDDVARTGH
jgi:TolB-like protein